MPFTFSHPAAILPFVFLPRKWVSVTGLVIGSLAPDFEKFLKMEPGNTFSHTWEGIFWFNLPMGIILCFVFHTIVRDPLIQHLPYFLKSRLLRFGYFDWGAHFKRNFIVVIVSILIGVVAHIAWDSFTHKAGLGVRLFPILSQDIVLAGYKTAVFSLLDNISTVTGALLILGSLLLLPPTNSSKLPIRQWSLYWPMILFLSCLIIVIRLVLGLAIDEYWSLLITSISAALLGLVITSFFARKILRS